MNNIVDIETPIFVLIDEINNGNLSINELTDDQIKKLSKKEKEKAIKNA